MTSQTTDLARVAPSANGAERLPARRPSSAITAFEPRNFEELARWSEFVCKSELVPKEMRGRAADVFLAVQHGAELGLSPAQSLQSICVINGRPSVWGDAIPALIFSAVDAALRPLCEDWEEGYDIDDAGLVVGAWCRTHRRGDKRPVERAFSIEDAKRAALWTKPGPWVQYPKRMLQMRARSWCARDVYPDVLKGIQVREEVEDYYDGDQAPQPAISSASKGEAVRQRMTAARTAAIAPAEPTPTEAAQSAQPSKAQIALAAFRLDARAWGYDVEDTDDMGQPWPKTFLLVRTFAGLASDQKPNLVSIQRAHDIMRTERRARQIEEEADREEWGGQTDAGAVGEAVLNLAVDDNPPKLAQVAGE